MNNKRNIILATLGIVIAVLVICFIFIKTDIKEEALNLAKDYVKSNNITNNQFISLYQLGDDFYKSNKCNKYSGFYYENNQYFDYLICEDYESPVLSVPNSSIISFNGSMFIVTNNLGFVDPGYSLFNNNYHVDVFNYVKSTPGFYKVYYLVKDNKDIIKEQYVRYVLNNDTQENISFELKGDDYVYINKNIDYTELGYTISDNYGSDLLNEVLVTNNVNKNVPGEYEIIYRYKDYKLTRKVRVVDLEYSISGYNSQVSQVAPIDLIISISGNDYDYTITPSNEKNANRTIKFSVSENKVYNFKIYDKYGNATEVSIPINNLVHDNVGPTGTCTGKVLLGRTILELNIKDDSGVNKYLYNNVEFKENKYTINKEEKNVVIKAYDNYNNISNITCDIKVLVSNNMDEVHVSNTFLKQPRDWTKENKELEDLINEVGPKTRDAVVAAAVYLAELDYNIPYTWGGKYTKIGLDPNWGTIVEVVKQTCSVKEGDMRCRAGLDCTGYTSWAYAQAGFPSSIIKTSYQTEGTWGNFEVGKNYYSFKNNQNMVSLIKPGDIVHTKYEDGRHHVGIVLGTSDSMLKVANMRDGVRISYIRTSDGKSINGDKDFYNFALFDGFFEMYGNK